MSAPLKPWIQRFPAPRRKRFQGDRPNANQRTAYQNEITRCENCGRATCESPGKVCQREMKRFVQQTYLPQINAAQDFEENLRAASRMLGPSLRKLIEKPDQEYLQLRGRKKQRHQV